MIHGSKNDVSGSFPLLALFGNGATSELNLLSGIKRKLDFEPAKGSYLADSDPNALRRGWVAASSDAAEAGAKCDFRQRQVRLVNEPLGPLHAHGPGNLNRARSNVLLKQSAQMTGADSKPCGKVLHAALINRALMDQPHCPVDCRS